MFQDTQPGRLVKLFGELVASRQSLKITHQRRPIATRQSPTGGHIPAAQLPDEKLVRRAIRVGPARLNCFKDHISRVGRHEKKRPLGDIIAKIPLLNKASRLQAFESHPFGLYALYRRNDLLFYNLTDWICFIQLGILCRFCGVKGLDR
jgi:hypothetical protein